MKPTKAITWSELKEFVNTLDEEQLQYPVVSMGEERGFDIQSAETLGEDHYVSDYALEPVSVYDSEENEGLPVEESGYEIVKGNTPRLFFDLWEDEGKLITDSPDAI